MEKLTLYKIQGKYYTDFNYGEYVSDPHPDFLNQATECVKADCEFISLNDCNYLDHCIAAKKRGKIGLLLAYGNQDGTCYKSVDNAFKYNRIQIYANGNYGDEIAYAIGYTDKRIEVMKMDCSKQEATITILGSSDEKEFYPFDHIPPSHLYGYGFCPFATTPDKIESLGPTEIFVYGSNKEGKNTGGAALVAAKRFGAIPGVGVGRTGQAYAIPTMDGSLDIIREYVEGFRCYAFCHPELTFYVTRIGCGIAGWKDEQIAPLFDFGWGHTLANVILPPNWKEISLNRFS